MIDNLSADAVKDAGIDIGKQVAAIIDEAVVRANKLLEQHGLVIKVQVAVDYKKAVADVPSDKE
jgi:hypothetical protein